MHRIFVDGIVVHLFCILLWIVESFPFFFSHATHFETLAKEIKQTYSLTLFKIYLKLQESMLYDYLVCASFSCHIFKILEMLFAFSCSFSMLMLLLLFCLFTCACLPIYEKKIFPFFLLNVKIVIIHLKTEMPCHKFIESLRQNLHNLCFNLFAS